jgi:transcriptional regulator with XRE-family HTH domain
MEILRDKHTVQVIAANLRRLMKDRKEPFTQQSLATAAHVQQSAICRILNAQNEPSICILLRVCKALKCNLLQLLDEQTAEILETAS